MFKNAFFFSREQTGKKNDLAFSFSLYTHCFQEMLFLLRQKFLIEVVKISNWLPLEQRKEASHIQHKLFQQGLQVHLGEVLLNLEFFDERQSYKLLQDTGTLMLFCPSCRLYFGKDTFPSEGEHRCPQCDSTLKSNFANDFLSSLCRVYDMSPCILPSSSEKRLSLDQFLFLDIGEYLRKDLPSLEEEIWATLYAFSVWIDGIGKEIGKKNQSDSDIRISPEALEEPLESGTATKGWQDILAVTDRINNKLISLNKKNLAGEPKDNLAQKISISLVPLLIGYIHNLQELFWILEQKVFAQFAIDFHVLNPMQMDSLLQFQLRALDNGEVFHLGKACLAMYLLKPRQIGQILQKMGQRIYACSKCDLLIHNVMEYSEPLKCPGCLDVIEEQEYLPEILERKFSLGLFPTVPLVEDSNPNKFLFFRTRNDYSSDFTLSARDIRGGFQSFWKEISFQTSYHEDKEDSLEMGTVTQEISQLMQSMETIMNDEDIYELYNTARASFQAKTDGTLEEKLQSDNPAATKSPAASSSSLPTSSSLPSATKLDVTPSSSSQYRYPRPQTSGMSRQSRSSHYQSLFLFLIIFLPAVLLLAAIYISRFQPTGIRNENVPSVINSVRNDPQIPDPQIPDPKIPPNLQNPKETTQPALPKNNTAKKDDKIKPEQNREKGAESGTILQKFLQDKPSQQEIVDMLASVGPESVSPMDVPLLKGLYEKFFSDTELHTYIIRAMGLINTQDSTEWLEKLAMHDQYPEERMYAVSMLEKIGSVKSKGAITQIFQQESEDASLCVSCAYALCNLVPNDDAVYQELVNKFYQVESERIRRGILLAMARMKVKEIPTFLRKIMGNEEYNFGIRKEALEAIALYGLKNKEFSSQIISDLSDLRDIDASMMSNIEKITMRRRIKEVIEMVK